MLVSMSYHAEQPHENNIRVHIVKPEAADTLGQFSIFFGRDAYVYLSKENLLTLMYECETALHHYVENEA